MLINKLMTTVAAMPIPYGAGDDDDARSLVMDNFGLSDKDMDGGDKGGQGNDTGSDDDAGGEGDDADTDPERKADGDAEDVDDREGELDDLRPRDKDNARRRDADRGEERRGRREGTREPAGKLQRNADGRVIREGTRIDRKGNVIDSNTGKVLARAGTERQFYDRANHYEYQAMGMQRIAQDRTAKLNQAIDVGTELANRLKVMAEQQGMGEKLGLSADEQMQAFQFAKAYKSNPIEGIKQILTRAAAAGIDITKLGSGAGAAVDTKAILDLIREEMGKTVKPIEQDNQRRQQEAQAEADKQRLTQEVTQFFEDNPEAEHYMDVFEKMYADPRFNKLTLDSMWDKIRLSEHEAGRQLRHLRRNNGQRNEGRGGANKRPMPNGRSVNGRSQPNGMDRDSLSMDWGAIVNEVLDSTGVR